MRALLVPGCVIALLGVAAAVAVIEESRDPLIHEGDLVELMTAAAYGVGGVIGLIAVWRARSGRRALCVLPALAFLAAAEETSLPERLAGRGFEVGDVYVDAPHDLATALLDGLVAADLAALAVTVVLAGLGAAVALAIRRMPAAQAGARTLLDHPGRLEMLFAAGCLAAAFGLDAVREVTQHRKLFGLTFTEEALELTAAVALAVTCAEPLRARCW